MKEIIAIIRIEKINQTKKALLNIDIPGFTALKAIGRGKLVTDEKLLEKRKLSLVTPETNNSDSDVSLNEFVVGAKAFPCRVVVVLVADEDVDKVVQAIIKVNRTQYGIGDGKIFVMPLEDAVRVRTMETGTAAL